MARWGHTVLRVLWLVVAISGFAEGQTDFARRRFRPWGGFAHNAQHTAVSPVRSQSLERILWQTTVDLDPPFRGSTLAIHYGSPVITAGNTVIVPVKTGADGVFRVEARSAVDGKLKWRMTTDYVLPPHG